MVTLEGRGRGAGGDTRRMRTPHMQTSQQMQTPHRCGPLAGADAPKMRMPRRCDKTTCVSVSAGSNHRPTRRTGACLSPAPRSCAASPAINPAPTPAPCPRPLRRAEARATHTRTAACTAARAPDPCRRPRRRPKPQSSWPGSCSSSSMVSPVGERARPWLILPLDGSQLYRLERQECLGAQGLAQQLDAGRQWSDTVRRS